MLLNIKLLTLVNFLLVIKVSLEQSEPVFENFPNSISVNENSSLGQQLLVITISSSTAGSNPMSVSCIPLNSSVEACNVFQFNGLSASSQRWYGEIILQKTLDAVATPSYYLYLTAFNGMSSSKMLTINILQTRNRPPKFLEPTIVEIAERPTASNEQIIKYTAESRDTLTQNLTISYRIINGIFSNYFTIDFISGKLTNTLPLVSSNQIFTNGAALLQIEAAYVINGSPQWGDVSNSAVINSTIYFRDNNANTPTFDLPVYKGIIKETAPPYTFVENLFVTVTDGDRSPSSNTFDLTLDNYGDIFQITPSVGFRQVEARINIITSEKFNFNVGPRWYTFNIIARERSSVEKKYSQANVNVSLQQVNRFAPQFTMNPYVSTIQENATGGTKVVQVEAWDRDVGMFGNESIFYRFSTGAEDLFQMVDNGVIIVRNCRRPGFSPCLDYEQPDMRNRRLIVWAIDLKGEGLTGTTTVVVNVQNVNDNPPKFADTAYFGNIDDNNTTLILSPPSINATDADGDKITYSIVSNNYLNSWLINPNTGVLTAAKPITYANAPANGSFYLVVGASDGDSSHLTVVNVTIKVNPVNRYPPVFVQKFYEVSVVETLPPGERVIEVKATDLDPPNTDGGRVSYRIVTGGKDFFDILNPQNGIITLSLNTKLDYRTNPTFNLTVEASDSGNPVKSDTSIVKINVIPSRPYVSIPDYTLYILENEQPSKTIATVKAAYDHLSNPTFNYFLIEPIKAFDKNNNPLVMNNADKEMFVIDKTQGSIKVNAPLDANRIPNWQATIKIQEVLPPGNTSVPLSDTSSLIVIIYPANKSPPTFIAPWSPTSPFYNMTVPQGNVTQQVAGNFPASSLNSSLSIIYRLDDSTGIFALQSPYSGIVKQTRPIMEPSGTLTLRLVATDNGLPPLTSTATINVIVDPINMFSPVFSNQTYTALVSEDAPVGSMVIQVTATDNDQGDFGKIKYRLESSSDKNFLINPDDGTITVARDGQFDAVKNPKLTLEVVATDSPNNSLKSKYSNCYVLVTVVDVNNHPPQFTQYTYQSSINDDLPVQSSVLQVLATDGDLGENGRITYTIVDGNKEGYFSINSNSGLITLVRSLKSKSDSFTMIVNATDNGSPVRLSSSSTVKIIVSLSCREQCSPTWIKPNSLYDSVNVLETLPKMSVIYDLRASPYAPGSGPLIYSFINEMNQELNITGPFIIISQNNNATVNLNGALDYDTQNSYRLNIAVRDAKVANSQVTRYLNVFVTPFYTRNPQFAFDSNNCTVKLNETFVVSSDSKNQVIYTFKAKPNHKDAVINYYLDSFDDKTNKVFQLNQTTGELIIIDNNIASITRKTYEFVVGAKYMNGVLQNGQKEFLCALNNMDQSKINVTFTLNSPPPVQFPSNTLPICIPTTAEVNSTIDNLRKYATDQNKKDDIMFNADNTNPAQNNRNLKIMENGDLVLSTNPANIIGVTQVNVKSYYRQNPESETLLTLMGYIVTQTTDLTLITLNKKIQEFETKNYKNVLINQLRNFTNNGYVCLANTDPHILLTGGFNDKWTDVYLYVIDAVSNRPVAPLELDKKFNTVDARKDANIIGITGANTRWEGFNWNPVAIAIGLIMGLLLLACLFFCCFCFWIYCKKCCVKSVEKEPFIAHVESTGMVNRAWTSQQQLQEQQQLNLDVPDMGGDTLNKTIALHGQYDPDFVDYKPFAHARREDAATVDGGMSSAGISQGVPTGYVHIEAPLSRSTSALGRSDETAAGMSANAAGATSGQQTTTETTIVKETFERNMPHAAGNASYVNHEDVTKNTMYAYPAKSQSRNEQTRSKSVLNEIDEEELRKPIQLNEIANSNINGGVSQIGATLIRPETPGGQGYVQNIISGSEPNFRENSMALNEYSNYEGAYLQDPTRSNLAFQNEIIMNDVGRPISYYDEQTLRQGNIPLYTNDIGMMNMNRNADRRQESSYVEHIEETRFL